MADDDYKVGYKKPPLHTRFKKGKSGNPRGRPKRPPLSNYEYFEKEMKRIRSVILQKDGPKVKITTVELMWKRLFDFALTDPKVALQLVGVRTDLEAKFGPPPPPQQFIVGFDTSLPSTPLAEAAVAGADPARIAEALDFGESEAASGPPDESESV